MNITRYYTANSVTAQSPTRSLPKLTKGRRIQARGFSLSYSIYCRRGETAFRVKRLKVSILRLFETELVKSDFNMVIVIHLM